MSDKGVPIPPKYLACTLMNLEHIWTISIEILHVFNKMVAIILYADDVVILSKLGACLQRLLNKLMSFAIFLALKSISLRLNS